MSIPPQRVTTGLEFEGHRIVAYRGVVRGITVRSRNVFATFGATIQTLYDPPAPDDGLGASVDNLRSWKAGGIDWPEMEKRYVAGLTAPAAAAQLAELAALARRETVTVLCSCVDESQCHRGILKAVLAAARPVIGRDPPGSASV